MAAPHIKSSLLTADDYFDLQPEDRTELVRGEIVHVPPTGGEHSAIAFEVAYQMRRALEGHPERGIVLGENVGFVLARNPDIVRAPDAAFILRTRIPPTGIPKKFFEGGPDIAVEVISPSERWPDVEEKVTEYLRAGVQEVWLIEPRNRIVEVCLGSDERRTLRLGQALTTDLIPGFELSIDALFETGSAEAGRRASPEGGPSPALRDARSAHSKRSGADTEPGLLPAAHRV